MTNWKLVCFLVLATFTGVGCNTDKEEDEEDKNRGVSSRSSSEDESVASGKIILTSSSLAVSALDLTQENNAEVSQCQKQISTDRIEGVCITPTDILGRAHFIDAADGSLSATIDDAARIVKAGASGSGETEGQIILGNDFSLLDKDTINGTNELFSAYKRKPTYSLISFESTYVKFKFVAKQKFVTMLLVTHSQPFVESEVVTDSGCDIASDKLTQSRFKEADIFAGMTFTRGDYLFCVKDSASDSCAAADYKWLDTSTETLVDSRPSSPRVNQWLVFQKPTCSDEGDDRFEFTISGIPFISSLTEKFKLYGDYSHGVNSNQWPDEVGPFGNDADPEYSSEDGFEDPYVLYYYQKDGATLYEGTTLNVTLDFDAEDMLIVAMSEAEYDSASLAEVLAVVDSASNIGFHKAGQKKQEGYNASELASGDVSAAITLTGERTRPAD